MEFMKYAIFSDIHGNIYALEAALADANALGADMFLFLGDYCTHYPWVNEVVETIRGLGSAAVAVRGNNEGYLADLRDNGAADWDREQFKPIYWCFRSLKPENLEFAVSQPETRTININYGFITLSHSMKLIYRTPKINRFSSSYFRAQMESAPFTHSEYLTFARDALLSHPDAPTEIRAMPKGVYLFGHNHLQCYFEIDGKLFINPGSCGTSCDCDSTAAYTILETDGGARRVTERRVGYDVGLTAQKVLASDFAAEAPVWADIIARQLLAGRDYMGPFVRHIGITGHKYGQNSMPVTNDVWREAVATWDPGAV